MIEKQLGDWKILMGEIFDFTRVHNVVLPAVCDHLCYRVETDERYQEVKGLLLQYGELAGEELVSGRLISIFNLHEPLGYQQYKIDCIELPAPKEGSPYKEGWEHAEFVCDHLEDFLKRYSHLSFKLSGMSKNLNPEAALEISSKYQIKFHPLHILKVLEIEKTAKNSLKV